MYDATELLHDWFRLGNDDTQRLKAAIKNSDDRIEAVLMILETFAVIEALDTDKDATTEEIATITEIPVDRTLEMLQGGSSSDNPWCIGTTTSYGSWIWRKHPQSKIAHDTDPMFLTHDSRRVAAFGLVKKMGLAPFRNRDDELSELAKKSPAAAMAMAVWDTEQRGMLEQGILSVVNRPRPVWAGARGFERCYEACLERARYTKRLGMENVGGLDQMHCYAAAGMFEAKSVLVSSVEQVMALPEIPQPELKLILADLQPPMRPYFLDYTASMGARGDEIALPTYKSSIAKEGYVGLLGALVDAHNWADGIMLICPFFVYNVGTPGGGVSALGMTAVNQTDNPTQVFSWGGEDFMFKPESRMLHLIPTRDELDYEQSLIDEYHSLVNHGSIEAVKMLNMLTSANVQTVPKSLERRERKRADKRGWNVPEVVYVHRARKRYEKTGEAGTSSSPGHQFDVSAHYRHFTKGPHVWCRVCKGDPLDGQCSSCNGTGLDPDKVQPCTRIDERTGALTCPNGCRREFVPSHVRGPEDGVYIPKVRKFIS